MRLTRRALLAASAAACQRRDAAEPPPPAVELWFGGDFHVGGEARTLRALAPFVAGAHGIVNLEGPVGPAPYVRREGDRVRLHQSAAALGAAVPRVAIWTMANNHRLDRGQAGVAETRRAAATLGVRHVDASTRWRVAGREVELLSWEASATMPPSEGGAGRLLLASVHETSPSTLPTKALRQAVDAALGAGARVVVAHGSHRVGPVERRGHAVVAWGLGNLAFSCDCTRERDALLLRVRLGTTGTEARVIPIEAGLEGSEPRPARDPAFAYDVLRALGSSPLSPEGPTAAF